MCLQWDEDTQDGLQKNFFDIAAVELAWRGNKAAFSMLQTEFSGNIPIFNVKLIMNANANDILDIV